MRCVAPSGSRASSGRRLRGLDATRTWGWSTTTAVGVAEGFSATDRFANSSRGESRGEADEHPRMDDRSIETLSGHRVHDGRDMDPFVFDPSWLGDAPRPRRPLLMFDGG